jgi:hypothetical protein
VKVAVVGGLMAAAGGGIYLVASTRDAAEEREQVVAETPTPTDVERLNAKLESLGEPTIPPDWDLRTPFAYPTQPGDDAALAALGTPTPWVPSCGPQEGPGGAQDINDRYGDVRTDCHLYLGTDWLITTQGRNGEHGVIAILSCRVDDAECLAGRPPQSETAWEIYPFPREGAVKIAAFHAPDSLLMYGGVCFNISSRTYDATPFCFSTSTTTPTAPAPDATTAAPTIVPETPTPTTGLPTPAEP